MATYIGREGVVKLGGTPGAGNTLLEVRTWSLDTAAATSPDTVMTDTWDTHKATIKSFSGSIGVFWDPADTTGQEVLVEGYTGGFSLFPDNALITPNLRYYSGTFIITGISRSASHDGLIEASFSFIGTGTLATTDM